MNEEGLLGQVSIYDDKGRIIKNLFSNELLGSSGSFTWDGTTNDGTKAASLVRELDVGWVVNNEAEVTKLFTLLNSDKSLLIEKKRNISPNNLYFINV